MTAIGLVLEGVTLCEGTAEGRLLILGAPLSFWGGVDRKTGIVIDVHHPQLGTSLAGRVLALPTGRGSSSSTSVLAELIRIGHGPAAILLSEPDVIIALAGLVAAELYAKNCPIIALGQVGYASLPVMSTLTTVTAGRGSGWVRLPGP